MSLSQPLGGVYSRTLFRGRRGRNLILTTYRSFATTISQLKMCDFAGEIFEGFEML